ncbi:uncharacterized protein A1O5_02860 [Cladophialophora psammophila CBS 110553]|uniref:Uncharacterized protein n=1 Tax=Cladophialophora psammophila CBS 110553 TaxID=1182543 RepID=W9XWC8_9EURO|nr:uncharacterized protein A1O5_02860 [Cladophialophora psammophila CBS 110553]EXJ74564.1 hypothetical protein A1O5_02860 [Cladophialophora psammophila CBS 110553]
MIPEDALDQDSIQRICKKIDAKLIAVKSGHHDPSAPYPYTDEYSHALPTSRNDRSPTLRSESMPSMSKVDTRRSRAASVPPATIPERPTLNTVISWTSNATRRVEYEKIDRAHSGVRGFLRRILPRRLRSKDGRRGFFTGECDGDSVRRFRLDVSDDDSVAGHQEEEDATRKVSEGVEYEDEKGGSRVKVEVAVEEGDVHRRKSRTKATKDGEEDKAKTRRWSCFDL